MLRKQRSLGNMRQASHDGIPGASRISAILRSQVDRPDRLTPVEYAHRLATQQRQLLEQGLPAYPPLGPDIMALNPPPLLGSADVKMERLAERVSVLLATLQRRCDADKQEMDRQLEHLNSRLEARFGAVEARLTACEERLLKAPNKLASSGFVADGALGVHEARPSQARALIGGPISEALSLLRSENAELLAEQREQLQQLEELSGQTRHSAARLEQAERALAAQERTLKRTEEELKALLDRRNVPQAPPCFAQLEGALASVEQRVNEQQDSIEAAISADHRPSCAVFAWTSIASAVVKTPCRHFEMR